MGPIQRATRRHEFRYEFVSCLRYQQESLTFRLFTGGRR